MLMKSLVSESNLILALGYSLENQISAISSSVQNFQPLLHLFSELLVD